MNLINDAMPGPAPRLEALTAYRRAAAPIGIDLYLDGNEAGPLDLSWRPDPTSLDRAAWNRYPDRSSLQSELAARYGVGEEEVIVTAGADDAIDRLCRATLCRGRELLTHTPSFEMVPRYVALSEGTLQAVPWMTGSFPVDALLECATPETAVVLLVSPNNPTGAVLSADDVRTIHDRMPQAMIVVDGAYLEFADEDITEQILALPRTVVLRTFSKAWGLAGLRVGYAIGDARFIDWMRRAGGPYPVARASIASALGALREGESAMREFVAAVRTNRQRLADAMVEQGISILESQGNFVMGRTARASEIVDAFATRGIAIRGFGNRPDISDFIRITVPGRETDLDRVIAALRDTGEGTAS